MKYFIAHLLSGSSKAYHATLTRTLSERFRIFPLHERVTPHITVKAPFEASEDEITDVERILRAFAQSETAAPFMLRGFGSFGFRTVYMNVVDSPEAVSLVRRVLGALAVHASWMPRYPTEGNKLHASVARFLTRVQKRRISRFLKDQHPEFHELLDNIAILKKEEKMWKVLSVIPFHKTDGAWVSDAAAPQRHLVYSK